jgi:hypothetical protein
MNCMGGTGTCLRLQGHSSQALGLNRQFLTEELMYFEVLECLKKLKLAILI